MDAPDQLNGPRDYGDEFRNTNTAIYNGLLDVDTQFHPISSVYVPEEEPTYMLLIALGHYYREDQPFLRLTFENRLSLRPTAPLEQLLESSREVPRDFQIPGELCNPLSRVDNMSYELYGGSAGRMTRAEWIKRANEIDPVGDIVPISRYMPSRNALKRGNAIRNKPLWPCVPWVINSSLMREEETDSFGYAPLTAYNKERPVAYSDSLISYRRLEFSPVDQKYVTTEEAAYEPGVWYRLELIVGKKDAQTPSSTFKAKINEVHSLGRMQHSAGVHPFEDMPSF